MTTTRIPTTAPVTREAVRAALLELRITGDHRNAASTTSLWAIADARRELATRHPATNPAGQLTPDPQRLAALARALGDIGSALIAAHTLGWLDTLGPTPSVCIAADDPPF